MISVDNHGMGKQAIWFRELSISSSSRHFRLRPSTGWAIAKRIQQVSGEVLQVQQGSLYPALHRLEQQGWIKAKWMESETGRQAKFYSLTASDGNSLRRKRLTGAAFPRPSTW